jgi:hypothetical protein
VRGGRWLTGRSRSHRRDAAHGSVVDARGRVAQSRVWDRAPHGGQSVGGAQGFAWLGRTVAG